MVSNVLKEELGGWPVNDMKKLIYDAYENMSSLEKVITQNANGRDTTHYRFLCQKALSYINDIAVSLGVRL